MEPSSQFADCGVCTHEPVSLAQPSNVQGLLSSQLLAPPGAQAPAAQASGPVHRSPSSHALVLLMYVQPTVGSQTSSVQRLLSSQISDKPVQTPVLHKSPSVHALASVQEAPSASGSAMQLPVAKSQVAASHALGALHVTGLPLPHTPAVQVSLVVQRLLSSQLEPSGCAVDAHPLVASHVSVVQGLPSLQTSAMPLQAPASHASFSVQASLSVHVPVLRAACAQTPEAVSQVSAVQGLLSSHDAAPTCWHLPNVHVPVAQKTPATSHEPPSAATNLQAPSVHESVVQASLSLHATLSSVVPSQLSSLPLQVSVAASGALHAVKPLDVQTRLPLHVPKLLVVAHGVERPAAMALAEQLVHSPGPALPCGAGRHTCALTPEVTSVANSSTKPAGQSGPTDAQKEPPDACATHKPPSHVVASVHGSHRCLSFSVLVVASAVSTASLDVTSSASATMSLSSVVSGSHWRHRCHPSA